MARDAFDVENCERHKATIVSHGRLGDFAHPFARQRELWQLRYRFSRRCEGRRPSVRLLASLQQAHAPGSPTGLQALIGFLLLFRGNHGLTYVTALPDPGPRDKFRATAAALFRHRLLKRENSRFFGQKMRIMEIAMIHVRHLMCVGDHSILGSQKSQ